MKGAGISLSVSAVVKKSPQGHPTLQTTRCAFNIGSLSVKFSKGGIARYGEDRELSAMCGLDQSLCVASSLYCTYVLYCNVHYSMCCNNINGILLQHMTLHVHTCLC